MSKRIQRRIHVDTETSVDRFVGRPVNCRALFEGRGIVAIQERLLHGFQDFCARLPDFDEDID